MLRKSVNIVVIWLKPSGPTSLQSQGRIQDFFFGGGGDAKDYVPARTLYTSAEPNSLSAGVQGAGELKGPGSSRVVLMLSRAIWALF